MAARQFRRSGAAVPREELAAEARFALAYAASLFDETRGVPFGAYARLVIRHRLAEVVEQGLRGRRGPVVAFTDFAAGLLPGAAPFEPVCPRTPACDRAAAARELIDRVRGALPPRWFGVLALYYGEGHTLEEVGRHLGVSRERARQLLAKAVRRARELAGP
jgi:RNA polymerase sigma factor (sigma-70 family)